MPGSSWEAENRMYCDMCGARIPDNAKFCRACGTVLIGESQLSVSSAPNASVNAASAVSVGGGSAERASPVGRMSTRHTVLGYVAIAVLTTVLATVVPNLAFETDQEWYWLLAFIANGGGIVAAVWVLWRWSTFRRANWLVKLVTVCLLVVPLGAPVRMLAVGIAIALAPTLIRLLYG